MAWEDYFWAFEWEGSWEKSFLPGLAVKYCCVRCVIGTIKMMRFVGFAYIDVW